MPDTMIPEQTDAQPTWEVTARSPQLGELFAAVAKAQGEIEGAKKDSTNPHFKSKYADLASARDAVQGPLSKNGLALIQWPRTVNNGVEIETWLGHSSGQYMSGTLCMPCGKMDAHGVGSAITYGRRYALMAVTGVAPEDDDGNAAGGDRDEAGRPHFRPERRQMPAKENSMDAVAEEDRGLVQGDGQSKYLVDKRKEAEGFYSKTLEVFGTLQGSAAITDWYKTPISPKGRSTNRDAVERLKENFPDLGAKLEAAADEVRLRNGARMQ
jgi:hypothetical protein